tara:strand:- start:277 stop:510 length:234 start_codon:yes stop_codon:yes gene_type:complete
MSRFDVGDIVSYAPTEALPASLGFIIDVKDEDLVRVCWYVLNATPVPRKRHPEEWLPASILEDSGTFKILSKKLDNS